MYVGPFKWRGSNRDNCANQERFSRRCLFSKLFYHAVHSSHIFFRRKHLDILFKVSWTIHLNEPHNYACHYSLQRCIIWYDHLKRPPWLATTANHQLVIGRHIIIIIISTGLSTFNCYFFPSIVFFYALIIQVGIREGTILHFDFFFTDKFYYTQEYDLIWTV